jgi:hypothetical protein
MNDFSIKVFDRLPILRSNLTDDNGYVDLGGATVKFVYQVRTRARQPVTGSASVISAISGLVEYAWVSGDVTGGGVFYGEWRATLSGGKQMSFPNDGFFSFEVINALL